MKGGVDPALETLEHAFDFDIAGGDQLLAITPGVEALAQREEMFAPVIAHEAARNRVGGGFDPPISKARQLVWIALALQNGIDDPQSRDARDVCNHVVDLDIHLRERLLNMLDVLGTGLHDVLTVAQQTADGADLLGWAKARAQEPDRVKVLQPLSIAHVRLAPRHILDMARVDEKHLQSRRLQNLENGNPVNAGALHRHGFDSAFGEPGCNVVEVVGEGGKRPHRVGVAVERNRHVNFSGSDIDACRMGIDRRQGHI